MKGGGVLLLGLGVAGAALLLLGGKSPSASSPSTLGNGGGSAPKGGSGNQRTNAPIDSGLQSLGCELDDDLPEDQKVYILGQLALWNSGSLGDMDTPQNFLLAAGTADAEGHPKAAACLRTLAARVSGGTYV